ncbi:hypothetical protein [uncultured Gammaproteobacteria bacterium]|nr:hypothetical protein [uncultured Gammaproteobacteria bacterium]
MCPSKLDYYRLLDHYKHRPKSVTNNLLAKCLLACHFY